jgi:hypothetical protein
MDINKNQIVGDSNYNQEVYGRQHFLRMVIGLIIVVIGLITLARTTGYMDFQFRIVWQVLWPVIIVIIGLSLISRRGWISNLISAVATIFVVWVVALMLIGSPRIAELSTGDNNINFLPWERLSQIRSVERLSQIEKCLRLIGTTSMIGTTTTEVATTTKN